MLLRSHAGKPVPPFGGPSPVAAKRQPGTWQPATGRECPPVHFSSTWGLPLLTDPHVRPRCGHAGVPVPSSGGPSPLAAKELPGTWPSIQEGSRREPSPASHTLCPAKVGNGNTVCSLLCSRHPCADNAAPRYRGARLSPTAATRRDHVRWGMSSP